MDYKFFLFGIKDIFQNSVITWEKIESENKPVQFIRNNLLIPLIVLISISAATGSLMFVNPELSPLYSIFVGIKCLCLFYLTIYVTAIIYREITNTLDLGRDFSTSFKIIAYSALPLLLCQILSRLFESLLFINILGLAGLFIFWTGAEKMLNPPEYKKTPMLIAAFISFVAVYAATNFVLTKLFNFVFYTFFD